MSLTDDEILELHELLDDLVENNLAGKRLRRLQEWLVESESARRRYVRFMDLSASLRHYGEECFALDDDDAEAEALEEESEGLLRFFRPFLAIAAVITLVFLGVELWLRWQPMPLQGIDEASPVAGERNPASAVADESNSASALPGSGEFGGNQDELLSEAVGKLTSALPVDWAPDSELQPNHGDFFPAGSMQLEDGLAEIKMHSGALVVLEGPADFQMNSVNEIFLARGKLRAIVPPGAKGFKVLIPSGQVIDLGTEFGLRVRDDGTAEIWVHEGEVLYEGNDRDAERAFTYMEAGESISINEKGDLSWIDMPSEPFLGAADVEYRSMEARTRRYTVWSGLSKQLAKDRRLSLYFTFDKMPSTTDPRLRDDSFHKKKREDGTIFGCNRKEEGRWPGKGALRFTSANDRVKLKLAKPMRSLTLATWLRLDILRKDYNPIVHEAKGGQAGLSWGIDGRGRIILRTYQKQSQIAEYTTSPVFDRVRRWVHLATTYDAKQGKVTHYVDGRSKSRENLRGDLRLSLDKAFLGNVSDQPRSPSAGRNLFGTIDEFIVFREALDAAEIGELYEVGRPEAFSRLNPLP